MEQMTLEAQPRQREHKGDNKALRRTGRVPAVIYGGANAPLSVSLADHQLELILPGGAIYARAEEVTDPDEKRIVARQVLQNAGFAGFFEGYNPFKISDAELQTKISDLPVLRFQPLGLGSGAFDSGGWAWPWAFVLTAIVAWVLLK